MMKKLMFVLLGLGIGIWFGSCKKCYKCTSISTNTNSTVAAYDTSSFCGSGHVLADQKDQHESNGYTCAIDKD